MCFRLLSPAAPAVLLAGVGRALGSALGSARPLACELDGRVTPGDGTVLSFRRRGEIPAGRAAK